MSYIQPPRSLLAGNWPVKSTKYSVLFFILALISFPLSGGGITLSLSKDAPGTAREGDLIEYALEVTNRGTVNVSGINVLDALPGEVQFVQAMPTPGGTYDPSSGIWILPTLGTNTDDKTARLRIQALVNQNLINDPADVVSTTNKAEVIAPPEQTPLEVQVTTNVVCSFCIDWEIESVMYNWDLLEVNPYEDDDLVVVFFLWVKVTNNGPVASDATLTVTRFDVRGGGFGTVTLFPDAPVAVTLDPGQTQTIEFKSGEEEGDDFDFTAYWEVVISDVALLDPVLPNTVSGSYANEVEDAGGGCFIATAAYGSYLDRHVVILRNFRDRHLLTNPIGRWFVEFYYRHSPPVAEYIRERETLRAMVRSGLAVIVYSIEYPTAAGFTVLLIALLLIRRRKRQAHAAGRG